MPGPALSAGAQGKLLDRVRKLLALADSPNVHEAAAAAGKAQALIAAHRLEAVLAAEAAVDEAAQDDPIEQEVLETARRMRRWKTVLAAGLADANGCLAFTRPGRGRAQDLVLAGRAADRAAFHALWSWLVQTLTWLSASHGGGKGKRWHDDFRVGAALAVCERLEAAARAPAEALPPEALVRLEPALEARERAVKRYADDELRLKPGRSLRVDPAAFGAGREAGRDLELD